jgi:hypothetical protein
VGPDWVERVRAAAELAGLSMADYLIEVLSERLRDDPGAGPAPKKGKDRK